MLNCVEHETLSLDFFMKNRLNILNDRDLDELNIKMILQTLFQLP